MIRNRAFKTVSWALVFALILPHSLHAEDFMNSYSEATNRAQSAPSTKDTTPVRSNLKTTPPPAQSTEPPANPLTPATPPPSSSPSSPATPPIPNNGGSNNAPAQPGSNISNTPSSSAVTSGYVNNNGNLVPSGVDTTPGSAENPSLSVPGQTIQTSPFVIGLNGNFQDPLNAAPGYNLSEAYDPTPELMNVSFQDPPEGYQYQNGQLVPIINPYPNQFPTPTPPEGYHYEPVITPGQPAGSQLVANTTPPALSSEGINPINESDPSAVTSEPNDPQTILEPGTVIEPVQSEPEEIEEITEIRVDYREDMVDHLGELVIDFEDDLATGAVRTFVWVTGVVTSTKVYDQHGNLLRVEPGRLDCSQPDSSCEMLFIDKDYPRTDDPMNHILHSFKLLRLDKSMVESSAGVQNGTISFVTDANKTYRLDNYDAGVSTTVNTPGFYLYEYQSAPNSLERRIYQNIHASRSGTPAMGVYKIQYNLADSNTNISGVWLQKQIGGAIGDPRFTFEPNVNRYVTRALPPANDPEIPIGNSIDNFIQEVTVTYPIGPLSAGQVVTYRVVMPQKSIDTTFTVPAGPQAPQAALKGGIAVDQDLIKWFDVFPEDSTLRQGFRMDFKREGAPTRMGEFTLIDLPMQVVSGTVNTVPQYANYYALNFLRGRRNNRRNGGRGGRKS